MLLTIDLYYQSYSHHFEEVNDLQTAIQKIEYLLHQKRNYFDSFRLTYRLFDQTFSIHTKVVCFNVFMHIDHELKATDSAICEQSSLEATAPAADLRQDPEGQGAHDEGGRPVQALPGGGVVPPGLSPIEAPASRRWSCAWRRSTRASSRSMPSAPTTIRTWPPYIFLVNVINEEEESNVLYKRLVKIKLNIASLGAKGANISYRFGENSETMIVVASGNQGQFMTILQVFDNYKQFFGYERAEILHKNVNMLMPDAVGGLHDMFIEKFHLTGVGRILNRPRPIASMRKDGYLFPCELMVRAMPDTKSGYHTWPPSQPRCTCSRSSRSLPLIFDDGAVGYLMFDSKFKIVGMDRLGGTTTPSTASSRSPSSPRTCTRATGSRTSSRSSKRTRSAWRRSWQGPPRSCCTGLADDPVAEVEKALIKTLVGQSNRQSMAIRAAMRSSVVVPKAQEYIVKMVFFDTFSDGVLKFGMLYFHKTTRFGGLLRDARGEIKKPLQPPENMSVSELPADLHALELNTKEKSDVNGPIDIKALREQRNTFSERMRPKTDGVVLLCIAIITLMKVGMFIFAMTSEGPFIHDFLFSFMTASNAISNQLMNLNEFNAQSVTLSLLRQTSTNSSDAASRQLRQRTLDTLKNKYAATKGNETLLPQLHSAVPLLHS